jgi:ribosomal protein S18 acetylase RimI-like enzyme
MIFRDIADNLRRSFSVLAIDRPGGDVLELPGVSVASLGVAFQMFNAGFLSESVETQAQLEERLHTAKRHFDSRHLSWAVWICEGWLAPGVRGKLSRTCELFGLRLSAEMPGMAADQIKPTSRKLPKMEVRRVGTGQTLTDFRAIGSSCFHVPLGWFSEVFDERVADREGFACWVGYRDGQPIATSASVTSTGITAEKVIGIYNVATAPEQRRHGYAEAITRHAIDAAMAEARTGRIVLQSTAAGQGIYGRMGFRPVTRLLVYNSTRQDRGPA